MRHLWVVLSATLLVGGLAGAAMVLTHSGQGDLVSPPAAITVRPGDYTYQTAPGSKLRDFDLTFDLTLAQGGDSARVLVNLQEPQSAKEGTYDNTYYVDLSEKGTTIGSFEGGVPRGLQQVAGRELAPGKAHRVLVKRRTPWLTLVVDERIVAMVQDETHAFGTVAFGLHGSQSRIDGVKVQPIESLYFSDNFMQDQAEKSHWTVLRGEWSVSVLSNPAMSVDAFNYRASSTDVASAVTGEMFWDNYSFSAAARSVDGKSMGVLFYYRSEKDYYLFSWDRRDEAAPGKTCKHLIRMQDGVKTVLAESPGGFIPNQWYTLTVEADGRTIRASIDGNLVFAVQDNGLVGGMIGLYAEQTTQTRFDDVVVNSVNRYIDDMKDFPAGRWTVLGGHWKSQAKESERGTLSATSAGTGARCVTGSQLWQNYAVTTEMAPAETGRYGVDLYYVDEKTYYAAICERKASGDTWRLVSRKQDQEKTLGEVPTDRHEEVYRVQASANRGRLTVVVDGKTLIEAFDLELASGALGFWAEPVATGNETGKTASPQALGEFTGLTVDFLREEKPLQSKSIIMEHERSMADWSSMMSDWENRKRDPGNRWLKWNRGCFPGSSSLEVKMSKFDRPDSTATIVLNGDGTSAASGYRLEVGPKKTEGARPGERVMCLYRLEGNDPVARADVGTVPPTSVKLERTGGLLVGYLDGRGSLIWRDEAPLRGDRLGWDVTGGVVKMEADDVLVSSPNVYQYNFTQAPTEWRTAGGLWEVSNRWECDPRWSFFSGRSETSEVAALWSKRLFKGDVTVDYYIAPKMNSKRGNAYQYVRDFNCTIGADGKDLASGYSFLVGGFDNSRLGIYRGTKLLDEAKGRSRGEVIPRSSEIHHLWFHIRVQKKGDTLRLWYENQLWHETSVVECKDPEPLSGNRIAFWTKDCGVMVGKVVISCEDAQKLEDPDINPPVVTRSIYDGTAGAMLPGTRVSASN